MSMTDVQKIKSHLASGYGFVNHLQSVCVGGKVMHIGSSADRACRKICNGDKSYSYFMVKPSKGNKSEYKAFFTTRPKGLMISVDATGYNYRYRITVYTGESTVVSKAYKTKREAMKAIKSCEVVK